MNSVWPSPKSLVRSGHSKGSLKGIVKRLCTRADTLRAAVIQHVSSSQNKQFNIIRVKVNGVKAKIYDTRSQATAKAQHMLEALKILTPSFQDQAQSEISPEAEDMDMSMAFRVAAEENRAKSKSQEVYRKYKYLDTLNHWKSYT